MNAPAQHGVSRDDGFTIVELVLAALILFFALTALMTLTITTTGMSASSRGRTSLIDATSGKLDLYRTYAFSDIKLVSQGGKIPDTEDSVVAGWSIHYVSSVTSSTAFPNTKVLTIVATASRASMPTQSYTVSMIFRAPFGGSASATGSGGGGSSSALSIVFASGTPNSSDTVAGTHDYTTNTSLQVLATGTSTANKISAFWFKIDDGTNPGSVVYLTDVSGNQATTQFMGISPPAASPYTCVPFNWNVGATDGSGNYLILDGVRTISAWVMDDHSNAAGPVQRRVFVDNNPPDAPTGLAISPTYYMSGTTPVLSVSTSWAMNAMDGTDLAAGYLATLYRDHLSNTTGLVDSTHMQLIGTYATSPTTAFSGEGFVRYLLQVQTVGGGARAQKSSASSKLIYTPPIITAPSGTQSVSGSGNYLNVTYNASLPIPSMHYPLSSVQSIQVQYTVGGVTTYGAPLSSAQLTAAKTAWTAGNTYTVTDSFVQSVFKNSAPSDVKYRVLVQLNPSGYSSVQTPVLTSSAALLHSTASKPSGIVNGSALTASTPSW